MEISKVDEERMQQVPAEHSVDKDETVEQQNSRASNKYSIFDYFKKHPGSIVSCVTAIIAVASFWLNTTIYLRESRYLQYWGFETDFVDLTKSNHIYILVFALFFFISIMVIQILLTISFDIYYKNNKFLIARKYIRKMLLRGSRRNTRKIKKLRSRLRRIENKCRDMGQQEEIQNIYREIQETENDIDNMQTELRKAQELSRQSKKILIITFVPTIVVLVFLLFLVTAICTMMTPNDWSTGSVLGKAFLYSIFIFFCSALPSCIFRDRPRKRNVQKLFKSDYEALKIELDKMRSEITMEYPLFKLGHNGIRELLNNSKILSFIAIFFFSLFVVGSTFQYGSGDTMEEKNTFCIATIDEVQYSIIYKNGNTYYLEEAALSDDSITIDTRHQRIVVSDDIAYNVQEFTESIKLE